MISFGLVDSHKKGGCVPRVRVPYVSPFGCCKHHLLGYGQVSFAFGRVMFKGQQMEST